jgi:hypothetical protein
MPNRQWERWTDAEITALWDLAPETLLILLYSGDSPAVSQQRSVVHDYCQTYRDTRLLYRPFEPNIPHWRPDLWAEECSRRAELMGLPGEMICDNERNLAVEGGSEDWDSHARWLLPYAARWRELSRELLHLGALSPSGAYRVAWRRYRELGVFAAYDVADAHCYPGALADWRELAAMSAKPVSITEFNQTDPRGYFAIVGDSARDAVWFILSGTQDQRAYWLMGSPYYQAFKAPVPAPEPADPVVGEGFRKAEALVGGFVENEIWHLPGTDGKTSLAVGARGYAVWRARTNRTIAVIDDGTVWADGGNFYSDMRRLH